MITIAFITPVLVARALAGVLPAGGEVVPAGTMAPRATAKY